MYNNYKKKIKFIINEKNYVNIRLYDPREQHFGERVIITIFQSKFDISKKPTQNGMERAGRGREL